MRRLKKIFAGFLWGIVVGAVIGALGGTMDRGSMMILMPSGPPFWAIVGAFVGSIVGALYGALSGLSSQDTTSSKSGEFNEKGKKW
jgi:hypothetical protein